MQGWEPIDRLHVPSQKKTEYGNFCGMTALIERTKAENDIIDEAMRDLGIQQNKEKQVNVPHLFGKGASAATRTITAIITLKTTKTLQMLIMP